MFSIEGKIEYYVEIFHKKGSDKGKPGESRGHKATGLKRKPGQPAAGSFIFCLEPSEGGPGLSLAEVIPFALVCGLIGIAGMVWQAKLQGRKK